jgi:ketosteroid isomerase-like protein
VSQANVEIVREVYEAFTRRDHALPFASYAPDTEWDITGLGHFGAASVYHGHDGVRACFRDVFSAFGRFELHAEELLDSGDYVLVTVTEQGAGRTSGVSWIGVTTLFGPYKAARSYDCGSISITARDRQRLDSRNRRQVPVSGVRPRSARARSRSQ